MQPKPLRKALYRILETSASKRRGLSLLFNIILVTIITLNTVAIILNTVPDYNQQFARLFYHFELLSVGFFTIEYWLRIWVCVENEKYRHWLWGRIRYVVSVSALIDFLAIFPFSPPIWPLFGCCGYSGFFDCSASHVIPTRSG